MTAAAAPQHVLRTVEEEMRQSYLDYAMSVIAGRAIPDVRDGLKPVHRRVLYAMSEASNFHDKAYRKSARVVGDVIGKYHPHGDTAVYDTLVRMAQGFSMRAPLVDGQGNFGSVDGDAAAAMRYTEVRLSRIAGEMLSDIGADTIDMLPNYDGSLSEPSVLPTRFPNLLVNGSSGIAVGMATSIPPHNTGEIIDAALLLLKKPDATLSEIMRRIPGPDFPTGGIIHGTHGIHDAYKTGRGTIHLRARVVMEKTKKGDRDALVLKEIPYQVNKTKIIERIAEMIREEKISGIHALRDESDRDGMRLVIEVKKDADATTLLSDLYRQTQMQVSFGIQMLAIDEGKPKIFPLKDMIEAFLSFRKETVTRKTAHLLKKAEEKAHILEGLAASAGKIDKVIHEIKNSKSSEDARARLCALLKIDHLQAQAILDIHLHRLTKIERDKTDSELKETRRSIEEYRLVLSDETELTRLISKDLEEIRKTHADDRRTEIDRDAKNPEIENLSINKEVSITVTRKGHVWQNSCGPHRTREKIRGDFPVATFTAQEHNHVLFLFDDGKSYWLQAGDLPEKSKGKTIHDLLAIPLDCSMVAVFPMEEAQKNNFLMFATSQGIVKKTDMSQYFKAKTIGTPAIGLCQGDRLVAARLTGGEDDIFLYTCNGKAIRFNESNVRPMGREAIGVGGIRLLDKDTVVSMDTAKPKEWIVSVSSNGYAKKTETSKYPTQGRNGSGVVSMDITVKTGPTAAAMQCSSTDTVVALTNSGEIITIPVSDIKPGGRNTQGGKITKNNKVNILYASTLNDDLT